MKFSVPVANEVALSLPLLQMKNVAEIEGSNGDSMLTKM